MSKIGLYVYQLCLFNAQNYQQIPLANAGIGSELYEFLPQFVRGKVAALQNNNIERSWRLEPAQDEGRSRHGIVRYGTYGYSSNIINPDDNEVLFNRNATDVEEIPLYYRFWVPDAGNFGFATLQSFRDRSCVSQVLGELTSEFNRRYNHIRLTPRKVMPTADEMYRNAQVKKLILSKKRVPKDRAEILRNLPPDELNVELSFSVRRNGLFGVFSDVAPQIRGARGGAAFVFDGIEFDEASAMVAIGNSYMKVGIVGPSNNAGVIDISEEVQLGADQHPTFQSVSEISANVIENFRAQYGMR
ncbi:hypothetical protein [Sinirhodobacter huangdaonensis]|uniref:Uncharacterized protein n=1 Tax=Paenirhodobacter huangdaonensis TaxID=2501515 RepID=A0A443LXP8_9RHOB|nr:hypothetical protein [Sinirhodobacter huangdaonensis]RWR54034.1 hypothetical protein EOW66_05325 [Sinirhodobacter huangdaonensis]